MDRLLPLPAPRVAAGSVLPWCNASSDVGGRCPTGSHDAPRLNALPDLVRLEPGFFSQVIRSLEAGATRRRSPITGTPTSGASRRLARWVAARTRAVAASSSWCELLRSAHCAQTLSESEQTICDRSRIARELATSSLLAKRTCYEAGSRIDRRFAPRSSARQRAIPDARGREPAVMQASRMRRVER